TNDIKQNGIGHTAVTTFLLMGFMDHPELQVPLFILFLGIYLIVLVGNTGIIVLTRIDARMDSQLHTPMYFFLSNLSILDIGYSSVIVPRTLMTFTAESKTISFTECALQFFFCISVSCECCLLGVMAYDRFMAICSPLLYTAVMSSKRCNLLVAASYLTGCVNAAVQTSFIFNLSFCRSNVINHFFCDVPPILKLSCSDTRTTDVTHFTFSTVIVSTTILTILGSYVYILGAILKISSAESRHKAFSTCASHLTAVTIFYGTAIFMYLRPSSKYSMQQDKIISVFHTLAVPMLNPLIYSLRNKEVQDAFKRLLQSQVVSHK
uniref:Olfactory receptor n=1 Tax=Varanus komodoensis TaxID=61221 RepID=A0A8D2LS49_VARKO